MDDVTIDGGQAACSTTASATHWCDATTGTALLKKVSLTSALCVALVLGAVVVGSAARYLIDGQLAASDFSSLLTPVP